ncbi:MAG: FecR domain-containing protein [Pseudomonadota bacterium]
MTARMVEIRTEAHEWRARIDDGALDGDDRRAFDRWMAADPLHAAAYAEAELVWKGLGAVDFDPALDQPLAGERSRAQAAVFRHSPKWLSPAGAAAALVAVAAIFAAAAPYWRQTQTVERIADAPLATTYETDRGEIRTVALPDGSSVTLGALSQISFATGPGVRAATLASGSAFFDVADDPDAPFTVAIGGARVVVTGTVFDVQRRGDRVDVAVAEGSVRVTHPLVIGKPGAAADWGADAGRGGAGQRMVQSTTLAAGERVSASRADGLGRKEAATADALGAWRNGLLVYLNAPLGDVVADLNRYADAPITVDAAARELRLSGTFSSDDVGGLLAVLETALPVTVTKKDGAQAIEFAP